MENMSIPFIFNIMKKDMWVNYHVSEFIFSFAGTWNLGKWCVLYLNIAYAVITFILMLIPAKKAQ